MAVRKKTVAKKKASRATSRKDDGSFLIIVGGGFIVISLILFFSGMLPFSVNMLNVQLSSHKTLGVESKEVKTVTVSGDTFTPGKLLIQKGTKVVFTNKDNLQVENATADDGSFDTGPLAQGDSRTVEFVKGGIYLYHNADNPSMKGVILVLE